MRDPVDVRKIMGGRFQSRKYNGMIFKDFEAFKRYDRVQKLAYLMKKYGSYNGKSYLPKRTYNGNSRAGFLAKLLAEEKNPNAIYAKGKTSQDYDKLYTKLKNRQKRRLG